MLHSILHLPRGNREHLVMATELWSWQNGTSSADMFDAATMGLDGSVVLAGYTGGDWASPNAGGNDFAAVKLDADGMLLWQWQGGTTGDDKVNAAAMAEDGSVLMAGWTSGTWGEAEAGFYDFVAVKLDAAGKLLWNWQGGSQVNDVWWAVDMADDGSALFAGTTFGDWVQVSVGSWDFAAMKMDVDGNVLWTWQDGTRWSDTFWAGVMDKDGSVVLAGGTEGDFALGSKGQRDFVVVKLDAEGKELWRWQDGTSGMDEITCAAVGDDGSIVVAGNTDDGLYDHPLAPSHQDFTATKLDADGNMLWQWKGGASFGSYVEGVAVLDDGSILLSGFTADSFAGKNIGSYDVAAIKLDANGNEIWRYQDGTANFDRIDAAATGFNGRMIMAGHTTGDWEGINHGKEGFLALMLDIDRPSPSPVFRAPGMDPTIPSPTATPTVTPPRVGMSSPTAVPTATVVPQASVPQLVTFSPMSAISARTNNPIKKTP